jgi:hypothetical protein
VSDFRTRALAALGRGELHAFTQAELDRGVTRGELLDRYEQLRAELPEAAEDGVLDVMDCLVGRCAPSARFTDSWSTG